MESIQSKFSVREVVSHLAIFKEPRGLIRFFQFIFAIFAFATACNGRSSMSINVGPLNNAITASWSYPFNLQSSPIIYTLNNNSTVLNTISTSNDAKPAAVFFLFTGVTAMLLTIAYMVLYVAMAEQYRNNELLPIIDFTVTMIWTIFWIAGSSAWAQGVSNIRSQTAFQNIGQRSGFCPAPSQAQGPSPCTQANSGNYADIIVSVIFGYLNFILWAGSAWFVFKETKLFKARTVQQDQQQTQPQSQPNAFSNIGSPSMPQQSQFRPAGSMGSF